MNAVRLSVKPKTRVDSSDTLWKVAKPVLAESEGTAAPLGRAWSVRMVGEGTQTRCRTAVRIARFAEL